MLSEDDDFFALETNTDQDHEVSVLQCPVRGKNQGWGDL